jgi:hypothetical protein
MDESHANISSLTNPNSQKYSDESMRDEYDGVDTLNPVASLHTCSRFAMYGSHLQFAGAFWGVAFGKHDRP